MKVNLHMDHILSWTVTGFKLHTQVVSKLCPFFVVTLKMHEMNTQRKTQGKTQAKWENSAKSLTNNRNWLAYLELKENYLAREIKNSTCICVSGCLRKWKLQTRWQSIFFYFSFIEGMQTKGNNASFKNSFLSMKKVLLIKERLRVDWTLSI